MHNALDSKLHSIQNKLHNCYWHWLHSMVEHIGADFRSEVPGQSSFGLVGGGRGQWLGGTMASAEHEPIMGVWGQSSQRGPGAEPLKLKKCGHWMSNGAGKFSPFPKCLALQGMNGITVDLSALRKTSANN